MRGTGTEGGREGGEAWDRGVGRGDVRFTARS